MPGVNRAVRTAQMIQAHRVFGVPSRRRKLPRQQPPKMIEREYAAAVIALVVPRVRAALLPLYAALPDLLARAAAARKLDQRLDAGESKQARQMISAAREKIRSSISTADIEALAEKFARQTSTYQRVQLARQTQAALGVDVYASDRRLPSLIDAFVDANVGLVKDIGERIATRVELEVARGVQDGMLHGDLAEKLQAIGFGEERAALIARDQVGKLYGQINATRQSELGVDRFIWRAAGDERVRDLHEELDGEEFRYSEGGHDTEGLPGEPVLCRCWAEPIFDEILDAAEGPDDKEQANPPSVTREPERARARAPEPEPVRAPEPEPIAQPIPAAVAELLPAVAAELAPATQAVEYVKPKNPKRVEAAKKAAEVSHERRREVFSAVASNLPQELQVVWEAEGHKFMREEAGRTRGMKDRINVASKLSEAFAEKYNEGARGENEGDRSAKRAEIESKHAEAWADTQERDYYESMRKEMIANGEIDEDGNPIGKSEPEPEKWAAPASTDDDDPPF